MKEKLKSPVTWVSALGVVVPLVAMYSQTLSEHMNQICMAVITILGIFGILNNPNDREGF